MLGFNKIVEQKIQEAIRNGEFDNLELKGKPLDLDDIGSLPNENKMAYKILKNSGLLPEEMELKKEIFNLENIIKSCEFSEEKLQSEKEKLKDKILKYKELMRYRNK
ncbi:MAG: DUF1992 domain-containing protein [Candidatus Sericytochromatia bacterium]